MVFSGVQKGEILPENAILLNKQDALKYQKALIQKWEPQSYVLPINYGQYFLGLCSVIPSVLINAAVRKRLKLMSYGLKLSYLSTMLSPIIIVAGGQEMIMTDNILLLRGQTCKLCLESKSVFIQNTVGVLYPIGLSIVSNFLIAHHLGTRELPHFTDWRNLGRLVISILKSNTRLIGYSMLFSSIAASYVTHRTIEAVDGVNNYLKLMEEQEEVMKLDKEAGDILI